MAFASGMDFWSPVLINKLSTHFKVIVFDHRGIGSSTNDLNEFTLETLADDMSEFMDALGVKKINLFGWSMGSFVSQIFAAKYPEKLNKLVLYASNQGGGKVINPKDEIVQILSNPKPDPMQMLSTLFPDSWLNDNKEPWKALPPQSTQISPKTIGMQYKAIQKWILTGGGSEEFLPNLKMPVLLISGKEDKIVPPENSIMMNNIIPNSTLMLIAETGHGLMYQKPELFAELIYTFFNDIV